MMGRRSLLLAGSALALPVSALAQESDALAARLHGGGLVLLIRHAQTTPGVGDPPGFRLDDCSTQRNLSEAGRDQARAWGEWLRRNDIATTRVLSSRWCRCRETA
jgi:hypothetical protein